MRPYGLLVSGHPSGPCWRARDASLTFGMAVDVARLEIVLPGTKLILLDRFTLLLSVVLRLTVGMAVDVGLLGIVLLEIAPLIATMLTLLLPLVVEPLTWLWTSPCSKS